MWSLSRGILPFEDSEWFGSEQGDANRGDQASTDDGTQRPLGYAGLDEQCYGKHDSEHLEHPQSQSQPGQPQRSLNIDVLFHDKAFDSVRISPPLNPRINSSTEL